MNLPAPNQWTRRLIILLVLGVLAAACGGGSGFEESGGGDQAEGGGGATGGSDGGDAGVSLQLMGFSSSPAEDQELSKIIDGYNEQSSNTAEFNPVPDYATTLQASLAGGEPPDVFYVNDNQIPDLATANTLAPAEGNIDNPDDFYPNLKEAFTFEGTWYCPPKDFSTLALQYNTQLLSDAGVEPPTNWDELRAAAQKLTKGDVVGLVLGPEYFRWGVFNEQAGGGLTNDDLTEMTAAAPPNVEAFDYLEQMYQQGTAAEPSDLQAGWAGEAFGQGKAAMTIEGNWMVAAMRDGYPDLKWETAELPEGPAGKGTFSFSVCYAVPQGAKNPDASWDLVNYLVSSEQMLAFTKQFPVMPSRPSLRDQWLEANPDLKAFLDSAEYARSPAWVPGFQAVLDQLNSGIQGIAAGNKQPQQVLEETQQTGQSVLGG
ncbi:MAG: ABC transporter substrate-binding protein [Egibacteraceae bacterium]